MAKTASKTPTKKVAAKKPASTPKAKTSSLEQTSEDVLKKLRELDLDAQLQADLEWCLGSYRSDKNPVGLYVMIERALRVLKTVRDSNPKLVSMALISNIEKALKSR